jgi:hypothetical protein
MGVFHPDLVGIQVRVLQRLGAEHVVVVYGKDGMDEVSLGRGDDGRRAEGRRDPRVRDPPGGLRPAMKSQRGLKVADAMESRRCCWRRSPTSTGTPREIVILNAGAALYAANVADVDRRRHRARARGDRVGCGPRKLDAVRRVRRSASAAEPDPQGWPMSTSCRRSLRPSTRKSPRRACARPCRPAGAPPMPLPSRPPRDFEAALRAKRRRRTGRGDRRDQEGQPEQGRVAARLPPRPTSPPTSATARRACRC